MTDSESVSEGYEEMDTPLKHELKEHFINCKSITGATTRYILKTTVLNKGDLLRKERIGVKDDDKPHKIILMVGETGTGKTALLNAMLNYMMDVRLEHKIWLEAVEISENQNTSQTATVTVYEVYSQNSDFSLTVIDTPGFGDTDGEDKDENISKALQQLFRSEDGIHEIHAVCLVLKASDTRLHERQRYILDEILSLFGKDIERHVLLTFTHHNKKTIPPKIFNFIEECNIKCAKKSGTYIVFTFDNCQSECCGEDASEDFKSSFNQAIENFRKFFGYLDEINPKSLNMTEGVLRARKQLDASINNLKDRILLAELRRQELEQTKAALEKCEKDRMENNNFEYEVDEPYKKIVPVDASWWHLSKQALHCTVCEENCHYPGCWWVSDLSRCSVMTQGKCTVCTRRCDHTDHVKDNKKYVVMTRKVKKTNEDLKRKYEKDYGEKNSLMIRLKNEIQLVEAEKIRLVEECYQCLEKLMETALKPTSMSSARHLDFMIEKVKETGKQDRIQKLEELKKKVEVENKHLIGKIKYHLMK